MVIASEVTHSKEQWHVKSDVVVVFIIPYFILTVLPFFGKLLPVVHISYLLDQKMTEINGIEWYSCFVWYCSSDFYHRI
jgi:hypothetical protein